jgi:hypothetical protein
MLFFLKYSMNENYMMINGYYTASPPQSQLRKKGNKFLPIQLKMNEMN